MNGESLQIISVAALKFCRGVDGVRGQRAKGRGGQGTETQRDQGAPWVLGSFRNRFDSFRMVPAYECPPWVKGETSGEISLNHR